MTGVANYPAPSHDPVIISDPTSRITGGLVETEVNATNAPAGLAAATGTANQPAVHIQPNAGLATGTGAAPQPEATVAPNAGNAGSTGTANQSSITIRPNAGAALVSGEAFGVTALTTEGAASRPVVATGAAVRAAQLYHRQPIPTAVNLGPGFEEPETEAPAGLAAATGTANQPTVQTSSEPNPTRITVVSTAARTAVARYQQDTAAFVDLGAPVIVEDVNAPAGLAAATGTANGPVAHIGAKPGVAAATGTSDGQTVQTGTFANAPAGLAAATGVANTASVTIRPNANVGLAAGVAGQPFALIRPNAGVGSGAGTAPQPTVVFGAQASAGLAAAVGTANQPEADIKVPAGVGAAAGQAFPVFGLTGNPTGPGEPVDARDGPGLTAVDGIGLIAVDGDHALEVRP